MSKKNKAKKLSDLQDFHELYNINPAYLPKLYHCPECGVTDTVPEIFLNCMKCEASSIHIYNYIKENTICMCHINNLYLSHSMYCIQCGCIWVEAGSFRRL
jgi:hypothetical protein